MCVCVWWGMCVEHQANGSWIIPVNLTVSKTVIWHIRGPSLLWKGTIVCSTNMGHALLPWQPWAPKCPLTFSLPQWEHLWLPHFCNLCFFFFKDVYTKLLLRPPLTPVSVSSLPVLPVCLILICIFLSSVFFQSSLLTLHPPLVSSSRLFPLFFLFYSFIPTRFLSLHLSFPSSPSWPEFLHFSRPSSPYFLNFFFCLV